MSFLEETLNSFIEPCAIYEWPDMKFVAINGPGEKFIQPLASSKWSENDGADGPFEYRWWWTGLTHNDLRDRLEGNTEHHTRVDTDLGIVHATVMYPLDPRVPRPPLLLCSGHPRDHPRQARETHIRMRLLMTGYELAEVGPQLLSAAEAQIAAVRDTIESTGLLLAAEIARINDRENLE